jgi:hypothetical protein
MKREVYYSDDYAVLNADSFSFYYGYEVTNQVDDKEEWCFNVVKDGKEIFCKTTSELEEVVKDCPYRDVRDYLMAGIALWMVSQE